MHRAARRGHARHGWPRPQAREARTILATTIATGLLQTVREIQATGATSLRVLLPQMLRGPFT
jgi:hypothetical protein